MKNKLNIGLVISIGVVFAAIAVNKPGHQSPGEAEPMLVCNSNWQYASSLDTELGAIVPTPNGDSYIVTYYDPNANYLGYFNGKFIWTNVGWQCHTVSVYTAVVTNTTGLIDTHWYPSWATNLTTVDWEFSGSHHSALLIPPYGSYQLGNLGGYMGGGYIRAGDWLIFVADPHAFTLDPTFAPGYPVDISHGNRPMVVGNSPPTYDTFLAHAKTACLTAMPQYKNYPGAKTIRMELYENGNVKELHYYLVAGGELINVEDRIMPLSIFTPIFDEN